MFSFMNSVYDLIGDQFLLSEDPLDERLLRRPWIHVPPSAEHLKKIRPTSLTFPTGDETPIKSPRRRRDKE